MSALQEKTFLGIDYGTKRIGLALGSSQTKVAATFKTIYKLKELKDIIPAKNVQEIIIGLPLQPDGTEGKTCELVRAFAEKLDTEFHLPIHFVDERLTSRRAEDFLKETLYMRQDKRKSVLDAESARIILQKFLDS